MLLRLLEKKDLKRKIRNLFEIAKVEKHHEERYRKLLENLKNGSVFKKTKVNQIVKIVVMYLKGRKHSKKCLASVNIPRHSSR